MDSRHQRKCLLLLTIFINLTVRAQDDPGSVRHHHSKILFGRKQVVGVSPDKVGSQHSSRKISRRSVSTGAAGVDTEAEKNLNALFGKCSLSEDDCNLTYKYRTFNGGCNNLGNPKTGTSLTELPRMIPAEYDDNKDIPRQKSIFRNSPLPNPPPRVHQDP